MLGLIFFIFGQLWHELKEEPDHWETRQDLDVVQRDTETLQQRNKGMKAGGGKRQKLSKKQVKLIIGATEGCGARHDNFALSLFCLILNISGP